jgi:hypothetical protein
VEGSLSRPGELLFWIVVVVDIDSNRTLGSAFPWELRSTNEARSADTPGVARVIRAVVLSQVLALAFTLPVAARVVRAPVPDTECSVFPPNNVWNMDVRRLPVHPKNSAWKKSTHAGTRLLHPDFGPPSYGIPFDIVGKAHRRVRIDFTYASESDPGPYPFGKDITIEGGSDRHAIMIDRSTCRLYELFAARWNSGDPKAGSGAIFDLEGPGANDLRPAGWTSADAAGLPIFPGLVRFDEVQAGAIRHALRFTVGCTRNKYVWPARHQAGVPDPACPPMGARFRLKAGFSLEGFSRNAKVILRAMKRYGMIVADNGSDWYFQGTADPRWKNSLLDQLKSVPAGSFVAVDESGCRVKPASAAYAYGPDCPAPK